MRASFVATEYAKRMPLVTEEEIKSALAVISENLGSTSSREEISNVENAVWKLKFRPQPLPYVAMSVEEARSVTDLSGWTNLQVRVTGMIVYDIIPWLVSVDEDKNEKSHVALDLSVVSPQPPFERLIQVFGILDIESMTAIPQIQVWFFRYVPKEDLTRYRQALAAQKTHVPMFVKWKPRRNRMQRNESESSEEIDPEIAVAICPCAVKAPEKNT